MSEEQRDERDAAAWKVVDAVRAIPEGWVRTYGDVNPGAPRFTGAVLRHATVEMPWWRIVRADGSLAQGQRQFELLDAEGVPFKTTDPPRVDLSVCRIPVAPE